jgi:hypothetical protein
MNFGANGFIAISVITFVQAPAFALSRMASTTQLAR